MLCTAGLLVLYLALLQPQFMFTGDTWAEAYTEYLQKALTEGWAGVLASSWEGYVTILPSFFSQLFVALHGPLGMIDYYYRFVAVAFAVGSLAFVAAPFNRRVIRSDAARTLLAFALLLLLCHVSVFSFINIWYVGFVPLIFVALNPAQLSAVRQVAYVALGVLVAFTKPSIILAPFVAYRAIRTKEYISNGIILTGTLLQTYLLFFASELGARKVAIGAGDIAQALYYGSGVSVLKLVHIYPAHGWYVLLANIIVVGLFAVLFYYRRWWIGGLLLFAYAFSIYSNLLAPDVSTIFQAGAIYDNHSKIQRDFLTHIFLVLLVSFAVAPIVWSLLSRKSQKILGVTTRSYVVAIGVVLAIVLARMFVVIDTTSSSVAADFSTFRHSMTTRQPICLPVAPAPTWSPGTNWYLQYINGCRPINFDKIPDIKSFKEPLTTPATFTVPSKDQPEKLQTLMLLVEAAGTDDAPITLTDVQSGIAYSTSVKHGSRDHMRYVSFNLNGFPQRDHYDFQIASTDPSLKLGSFTDGKPAWYAYFVGLPAPPKQ